MSLSNGSGRRSAEILYEIIRVLRDEFLLLDLREPQNCRAALSLGDSTFDEVYQLAADMSGKEW